jgi:glycosyltransferase involved in cell wall biosynthesis
MKMCQAFSLNGHEVVLLAPNIKNLYEKDISNVFKFYGIKKKFHIKKLWHPNIKGGAIFYLIHIFFYLIFNSKFSLVYGRFLHGCYLAALMKKDVVFETHEILFEKEKHKLFIFEKLIKKKFFKNLVVISKALKKIYIKKGYLNDKLIQVAHDGADEVKNFNSKIKLFGPKKNLKIGYVGHLYKGRGVELIIECAKYINDISFHIVGGLDKDIQFWKNYIKNFKLKNIFFYGFVSPSKTPRYRNSFDIVLAPYSKKVSIEGLGDTSKYMSPIKIFEYMSHKKPIIASDLSVIREVLNKNNSLLVDCDNVKSWIRAIKKLKNEKKRHKLSTQALIDFKNFTWKNRANIIIKKLYKLKII